MRGSEFGGGIVNRGNTCYISASLQVLLRFKPFHELITEVSKVFSDVEFFMALEVMSRKLENAKEALSPDSIIRVFDIDPSKQFDVCEFMTNLLNRILDVTSNPKVGLLFYFHFVKLDDPRNVLFRGCRIVENASIGDVLNESVSLSCSFPELLLIQLDRIKYDTGTNALVKDSRVMKTNRELLFGSTTYYLYAIIEHMGKPDHGHYVAYVQDRRGWLKCNDSCVVACAYVKSLDQVRTLRRSAPEESLASTDENVHFRLFDAVSMSIIEKIDVPLVDAKDIQETIDNIKDMWSRKHGRLRVRYKVNKSAIQRMFPDLSNFEQADLLVWFEPANELRLFDPILVMDEPVTVNYRIHNISNFVVPIKFHPSTKIRKLARYAKVLVNSVAGKNDRRRLHLYIQVHDRYVKINQEQKVQQSLFECQAFLGKLTVIINMCPLRPRKAVYLSMECYESRSTLTKKSDAKMTVEYHQTFKDLLNAARKELHTENVAIYSVTDQGVMKRIRGDDMPLYRVVMENRGLRAEDIPRQNSYNFIVVDQHGKYTGTCGMFDIKKLETVEMLERRAEKFFDIPRLSISFRTSDGVTFKPQNPYDEMPKTEEFVVICTS